MVQIYLVHVQILCRARGPWLYIFSIKFNWTLFVKSLNAVHVIKLFINFQETHNVFGGSWCPFYILEEKWTQIHSLLCTWKPTMQAARLAVVNIWSIHKTLKPYPKKRSNIDLMAIVVSPTCLNGTPQRCHM